MANELKEISVDDLFKELEEKRMKKKASKENVNDKSNIFKMTSMDWPCIKRGILIGLNVLAALSVGIGGTAYIRKVYKESKESCICEAIKQVHPEAKNKICQDYDGELLMLINDYQSGKKLNGFKMSPRNAVFSAHSDLLYKYGAYNPDVGDDQKKLEDWILLDHMCYRYYQYRDMELSNARNEVKNPYADMLRSELIEPSKKRVPVRHNNFFEGLKLDNVMKR